MSKNVSVAEIKAHFADWVRAAEAGESVVITRHGKPVVALVPAGELEQLRRLRAAGPERGLASLAGGWEGSDELVERVAEIRRSGPRDFSGLD
ncbi:MAG: type II toxin-antitoxin system Phd/YefM family antitoxin [Acidobacteria bacterium]|jgi:prevent-host-death family protein|nr:MAG: type II toxin-antitoxin system Phd/YefM family antitoxin [Acidobacteriota bacterium]